MQLSWAVVIEKSTSHPHNPMMLMPTPIESVARTIALRKLTVQSLHPTRA